MAICPFALFSSQEELPQKKFKTNIGIYTIGDLAGSDPNFLQAHLNSQGITLWNYANGRDDSPVKETPDAPKGYGNSMTLSKDLTSFSEARPVLLELCETVTKRLRADYVYAQVIEVELKDKNFRRKISPDCP